MLNFKLELYERVGVIQSKSLIKTVRQILNESDEGFWSAQSSTGGKYHPAEDQGEGGLVRHVIKASYVFEQEARRSKFEDYEFDAGIAAAILHDIKKNGKQWGMHTDYRHGIIGAEFIKNFYFSDNTIKKLVMNAVRYHMAPWNTIFSNTKMKEAKENPKDKLFTYEELLRELEERTKGMFANKVEKAVQDADYWASRECMSFYPGKTIMPDINKVEAFRMHDSPEEWIIDILSFNGLLEKCDKK